MLDSKAGNKKGNSNFSNTQKHKVLEVGKFYLIHDGSPSGHPGLILWGNDFLNIYLLIRFGTSSNPKNVLFPHPVGNGIKQSFMYKKPFLAKRKDVGSMSFNDMLLKDCDYDFIKNNIDITNPTESSNIRSKDRRNFLRLYIKKLLIQEQMSYPRYYMTLIIYKTKRRGSRVKNQKITVWANNLCI